MNKIILFLALLFFMAQATVAQNVGIGTNTPDASAVLELSAKNKGFLPPRMSQVEKGLLPSPKAGLIIYQTDGVKGLYIYNGTLWEVATGIGASLNAWSVNGNSGTSTTTNFIGTTDNQPLKFRVNNFPSGEMNPITSNTAFGIYALSNNVNGNQNTAVGFNSLKKNTDGNDNTAIGIAALSENLNGAQNLALGTAALVFNKSGKGNVAAGYYSLYSNVSGYCDVAMGTHSLFSNISGNNSVAVGDSALFNNTISGNTGVGSKALLSNTTGASNSAFGYNTLYSKKWVYYGR
ncbi:hypothetical protein BH11BAC3_BH11BAC3_47660 [soil metagenome]